MFFNFKGVIKQLVTSMSRYLTFYSVESECRTVPLCRVYRAELAQVTLWQLVRYCRVAYASHSDKLDVTLECQAKPTPKGDSA